MSEKTDLYEEHARLVNKLFFHQGLSDEEEQRLREVRDRLDEIEMEEYGHDVLDKLRQKAESWEKLNQQAKELMAMAEKDGVMGGDDDDDDT